MTPVAPRSRPHWAGELLVLLALALAYDRVIDLVSPRVVGAVGRGEALLRLEGLVRADPERGLNHLTASSHVLILASSVYYDLAHVTVTLGALLTVYVLRPAAYRRARNALLLVNLTALVVFLALPTAPPRLLPGNAFVDVVARSGTWGGWEQASTVAAHADLYASVPSLHLAWAAFVVLLVRSATRRRALRHLASAHLALTALVVLGTGNHYLVDLVAGAALTVVAWRATAPATTAAADSPEVVIVSASMGAGHDGVAYELCRRLRTEGVSAEVVDYLTLLPWRSGALFKRVYGEQLRRAPATYEWLYARLDRRGALQAIALLVTALARRPLQRLCEGASTVVATYPLAGRTLGQLRRRGRLEAPALTFLTDPEVHALWLDKGTDLYLAAYEDSGRQASERTGRPAWACGPLLPPRLAEPVGAEERCAARAELGLADERVALLVTGSWGVGDVATTAALVARAGLHPLVLCGRNDALRAELEASPWVRALGWVDDVRPLYAASDVVVHNAGGLASVEAFAAGVPVVGHACLPGHGHRNAEEMARQGIAEHAPDADALVDALGRLAGTRAGAALAARARQVFAADPTPLVSTLARSPRNLSQRAPRPAWVRRVAALAVTVPVLLLGVTSGVSEATEHGFGATAHLPANAGAVYLGVVVDEHLLASRAAVTLLSHRPFTVLVPPTSASEEGVVRPLHAVGMSVLALSPQHVPRSPRRAAGSFAAAAHGLAALTGGPPQPVVCLHGLGALSLVEARASHVRFVVPRTVFHPGQVPRLSAGSLAVLDLRGRPPAELGADLDAAQSIVLSRGLRAMSLPPQWTGA